MKGGGEGKGGVCVKSPEWLKNKKRGVEGVFILWVDGKQDSHDIHLRNYEPL